MHKEVCEGHLRKVGMSHLEKANIYHDQRNCPQILRHAELAATKLKQLKDRPITAIDEALKMKHNALNCTYTHPLTHSFMTHSFMFRNIILHVFFNSHFCFICIFVIDLYSSSVVCSTVMGRHREALECAKEWYCLYLTKHTHPPAIIAAFALIESCLHNREFADASLYALTTWETITKDTTSHIPVGRRQWFVAEGASLLAKATLHLAHSGGIPLAEKPAAGLEAITLARRSLEIQTQLHGAESDQVGEIMITLANILDEFHDYDDEEVLRLHVRAKTIHGRVQGLLSPNVAAGEGNLGVMYQKRAHRAHNARDFDREMVNLELALPHFCEAVRIYRAISLIEPAETAEQKVIVVQERLHRARTLIALLASSRG